jgi:hypothetical protein
VGENSMNDSQFKTIDRNQVLIMILLMLISVALIVHPVQSGELTLTMSNPNAMSERDFVIFYTNSTMQGYYNSTSVITLDTNESYIMVIKPMQTNPLEDPGTWLTNSFIPLVTSNAAALILMVFLAMLWLGRK